MAYQHLLIPCHFSKLLTLTFPGIISVLLGGFTPDKYQLRILLEYRLKICSRFQYEFHLFTDLSSKFLPTWPPWVLTLTSSIQPTTALYKSFHPVQLKLHPDWELSKNGVVLTCSLLCWTTTMYFLFWISKIMFSHYFTSHPVFYNGRREIL